MPYGTVVTWSEFLNGATDREFLLLSSNSFVEDLHGQIPTDAMIVLTHRIDGATLIHGSLVVEGGQEEKARLMRIREGKTLKVKVKNRETHTQSFLNIQILEVNPPDESEKEETVD